VHSVHCRCISTDMADQIHGFALNYSLFSTEKSRLFVRVRTLIAVAFYYSPRLELKRKRFLSTKYSYVGARYKVTGPLHFNSQI